MIVLKYGDIENSNCDIICIHQETPPSRLGMIDFNHHHAYMNTMLNGEVQEHTFEVCLHYLSRYSQEHHESIAFEYVNENIKYLIYKCFGNLDVTCKIYRGNDYE